MGCLQYHTSVSGTVSTFNWSGAERPQVWQWWGTQPAPLTGSPYLVGLLAQTAVLNRQLAPLQTTVWLCLLLSHKSRGSLSRLQLHPTLHHQSQLRQRRESRWQPCSQQGHVSRLRPTTLHYVTYTKLVTFLFIFHVL